MRPYMKARYKKRRAEKLKKLGGKCAKCGSRKKLEIDHINPKLKTIDVSSKTWSNDDYWKEIEKCQLLCRDCHIEKSILDRGFKIAKGNHGTISTIRWCRPACQLCKDAKREYNRLRRLKKNPNAKTKVYGLVHGMRNGYVQYKCRCDLCTNANSEYGRSRRKQNVTGSSNR